VTVDGQPLNPRLDLWNHSPTEFEWGYRKQRSGAGVCHDPLDPHNVEVWKLRTETREGDSRQSQLVLICDFVQFVRLALDPEPNPSDTPDASTADIGGHRLF
jgi:hypothetical protein